MTAARAGESIGSTRSDEQMPTTITSSRPRTPPALDPAYWIDHCEGFRVDAREGRLGFVEEIRPAAEPTAPPTLVVRAGLLGRRHLLFPADSVTFVVPRARRIWIDSGAAVVESERRAPVPPVDTRIPRYPAAAAR